MWPNPQESADLVTLTEEILHGKLHFLFSAAHLFHKYFFRSVSNPFLLNDTQRKNCRINNSIAEIVKTESCLFLIIVYTTNQSFIIWLSFNHKEFNSTCLILFRMAGGGGGGQKSPTTSFSSITSTNVGMRGQKCLTFSFKFFATLV